MHIPEIRRDSATPSWRIWAARSPNDFNGRLEHAQFRCSVLSAAKQAWRGGRSRRNADTSMQPDKATQQVQPAQDATDGVRML